MTKAGSKQEVLIILGSNGNIGKALTNCKATLENRFASVYCIDTVYDEKCANDELFFKPIVADVVNTNYLSTLSVSPSLNRLTILNLVAQDYPVTSVGLGQNYSSPFCLDTLDYLQSVAITAGSSYNLFHQIDKHKFFDSSVWLVGSIYNKILPDPSLYSEDKSIFKPIAYSSGKYAQLPLRDQAAVYFGPYGGRCNSLSFGGIRTNQNQIFIERYSYLCPSGQLVEMEEVISTIIWALTNSPASMNGADIMVDGAFHLK